MTASTEHGHSQNGHSAQPSLVLAVHPAEGHWRELNQEGPRRVHACTALLSERHLTAADLPGQVNYLQYATQELAASAPVSLLPAQITELRPVPPASEAQVLAVHSREWLDKLRHLVDTQAPAVIEDDDIPEEVTYITKSSFQDALQVHRLLYSSWPRCNILSRVRAGCGSCSGLRRCCAGSRPLQGCPRAHRLLAGQAARPPQRCGPRVRLLPVQQRGHCSAPRTAAARPQQGKSLLALRLSAGMLQSSSADQRLVCRS